MAAKKSLPDRVQLKGLDSLFGIDQEQTGQVLDVPIRELFPFQNHPFKVLDDEKMAQTVESVRENGIIRDLTDDEAVIAMVDANLQREEILPSEKAFAYKMKLDALKHKAGRPSKENLRQVGENYRSYDLAAENSNDSARTIQRYIRLTELLPDLLELVDSKKIKFNPAVELSYITPNEQFLLLEVMKEDDVVPSLSQAQQIKKLSQEKRCTKEALHALLAVASIKERNVVIKHEVIMQYFPAEASDAEIESLIVRLLADYRKTHGGV